MTTGAFNAAPLPPYRTTKHFRNTHIFGSRNGDHEWIKKRISVIFLIVLSNAMAATAVLPMLPIYVEGEFQATPVQAMLVIVAYYASQFVAAPWLGRLSDRFGRRPILIISQLGTIMT